MAIAVILAANALAFLAFGLDKKLAEAGGRRISESKLLLLALLGGSIGAVAAQQFFRHKTRKEPFRTQLYGIVLIHAIGLSIWLARPDLFSALAG